MATLRKRANVLTLGIGVIFWLPPIPPFSVWSQPSESTVVYSGKVDGKWDLYAMDTDGRNLRRLTDGPDDYWDPAFSPDGKRIVFVSKQQRQLAVIDTDGSHFQWLATDGISWPQRPKWSADGTEILFHSSVGDPHRTPHDIFVLNLTSGAIRHLAGHPQAEDAFPDWSPDGRWVVFASNRDRQFWLPDPNRPGEFLDGTFDLHLMDSQGNNLRNLTQTQAGEKDPAWSPDGTQIAFVRVVPLSTITELHVMEVETGRTHLLTRTKGKTVIFYPSWTPDSRQILFTGSFVGRPGADIYIIDRDGKNLRALTDNLNEGIGAYGPVMFGSPLGVLPVGKHTTTWGEIKRDSK